MPTPGEELASLDFESMIGGPLVAVVNAQAQSAMATVNFLKEVGFKKPEGDLAIPGQDSGVGEPIYVTFRYDKEVADADGGIEVKPFDLTVPVLTMLPIPYLRVEETTISFNAKINSIEYRKTDTNFNVDTATSASAGWLWGSAKLKVSTSYQRSTKEGNSVNRTYSMAVTVRAVQDEIPAGVDRILGILEDSITSKPAAI